MIFATVGTHTDGFPRLVRGLDEYAATTDEQVVIHRGHTEFVPEHAESFTFIEGDEAFQRYFEKASVVVAHGGAGTLIDCLSRGIPTVVMPRRAERGEHVDDQQLELPRNLAEQGRILLVEDGDELAAAIEDARTLDSESMEPDDRLVGFLSDGLDGM